VSSTLPTALSPWSDPPLADEQVPERLPDLAIVDVRMPPTMTTEGLVAARAIRERFPAVAILVLSAYVEVDQAVDLLIGLASQDLR
jgi:CheY-like chemotaxis protein